MNSLTSGFFTALVFIELIGLGESTVKIIHVPIILLIWLAVTVFFYYRNIKKSGEFSRYILKNIQETLSLPLEWINH